MKARGVLLCGVLFVACSVDTPEIIGIWKNGTNQVLRVGSELDATMTQSATCAPTLTMFIDRDPFDGYAVRFDSNQRVFYPEKIAKNFIGDSFCSSQKSVPMCRFCQIDGSTMSCESAEQEIVGFGFPVTHSCEWTRLLTETSTARPAGCGFAGADPKCVTSTSAMPR